MTAAPPIATANGDDITADLAVLYDTATGSMNWSSGFLDTDEVRSIRRIGRLMGYADVPYQHDKCATCGHDREKHGMDSGSCLAARPDYDGPDRYTWCLVNDDKRWREWPGYCTCTGFVLAEDGPTTRGTAPARDGVS